MKRIMASSVMSLLFVFACVLIGAAVTGILVPFAPSAPERALMHWHAGITTGVFMLMLSSVAQRKLLASFHQVEYWLLAPAILPLLAKYIGSYFFLELMLFVCGWVTIWRIIVIRKETAK